MLTKLQALQIAKRFIETQYKAQENGLVIIEGHTVDREYGWVFFFNSKRFVETGNPLYSELGNCPLLIKKDDGVVVQLGTARPVDDYLAEFELTGRVSP